MIIGRYGEKLLRPTAKAGWQLAVLIAGSKLAGANGLRFGPDGRLYVAQAFGGQISAYDLAAGKTTVISGAGGQIIAPDDLAFDSHGSLFATEVMSARVSAQRPNGDIDVIAHNVPVANGIVVHNDRIFISEFNPEGRILELFADGSTPRVICSQLMMPNALSMGADNYLYFPLVPLGEIWRVHVDGGAAQKVAEGFNIPTAVKFSPSGKLVVVESGTGTVTALDVSSKTKTTLGKVAFGIDNLAFSADGRLFVSHFTDGGVVEITANGSSKQLVPGGMLGPFGLAVNNSGHLVIADGMSLAIVTGEGLVRRPAMLLEHGFPGYVRAVAVDTDDSYVTTNSAGVVARYQPGSEAEIIAEGFNELMGITLNRSGAIVVAEAGAGSVVEINTKGKSRVLVSGLQRPTGVHCCADGSILISESRAGKVSRYKDGITELLVEGLSEPHGVTEVSGQVYVVDRGSHRLLKLNANTAEAETLVENLPVGISGGLQMNTLPGIKDIMPGPLLSFSDIAALSNGALCIGGDEDGSVIVVVHEG
ncbi:MAG: SMP-30/gluconolactonase/LRE family protein [Spongiibacteraceae bacterium]